MVKVCNVLSTVIMVVLLCLALPLVLPMLFGYTELAVLSGSMEPTIPVGSIVYVDKSVTGEELEEGDVVTYSLSSGTFVTHRVLSVDDEARVMVTQGDANDAPDGEVSYADVVGKVKFHLPMLGYISTNIRTGKGIMAITVLVVVIILLNCLPGILAADDADETEEKKGKKDRKAKNADAAESRDDDTPAKE